MPPFDYPAAPHARKHGPRGYATIDSFRRWLRDEFSFRCVYCLIREQWGRVTGEFNIDHFLPQSSERNRAAEYDNLVYSCARCNATKSSAIVPDPLKSLTGGLVRLLPDGTLEPYSNDAEELLLKLDLNSPKMILWRLLWMRIVELARDFDAKIYQELLAFPDDLPGSTSPPRW